MPQIALKKPLPVSAPGESFTAATVKAATQVRTALAGLTAAVPGGAKKPRELERALEIDYKLAWRVFLVLRAPDAMKVASLVPKRPSIDRLLQAATSKELPHAVIEALREAAKQFEETVRVQAGDRVAFDAIVSGMSSGDGSVQIDLVERRTAFRVNSHIWGSQVDVYTLGYLIKKSSSPGECDVCTATGRFGFKRLRAGARATAYKVLVDGVSQMFSGTPLNDEAYRKYGVALIPEFSTQPLPEFKQIQYSSQWSGAELRDETLGQSSSVDLAFGSVSRDMSLPKDAEGRLIVRDAIHFRTPAAKFLFDFVVHRPSFGRVDPEVITATTIPGEQSIDEIVAGESLPIRTDVRPLLGRMDAADTPHAPNHAAMLRYAFKKLKWDPAEFDVYRLFMEYPVLHTTVFMQFKS